jgi:tRNA(fMet)-specific endonuclease VapC
MSLPLYLLDTDVSIDYLRGVANIVQKVQAVGPSRLRVSEITVAELIYGAAKSNRPAHHRQRVESFIAEFGVLPVYPTLDVFASEKARLEKIGLRLDDFTNNTNHFERMQHLTVENWMV